MPKPSRTFSQVFEGQRSKRVDSNLSLSSISAREEEKDAIFEGLRTQAFSSQPLFFPSFQISLWSTQQRRKRWFSKPSKQFRQNPLPVFHLFIVFFSFHLCKAIKILSCPFFQVLVEGNANSRTAILNRPIALNALTTAMVFVLVFPSFSFVGFWHIALLVGGVLFFLDVGFNAWFKSMPMFEFYELGRFSGGEADQTVWIMGRKPWYWFCCNEGMCLILLEMGQFLSISLEEKLLRIRFWYYFPVNVSELLSCCLEFWRAVAERSVRVEMLLASIGYSVKVLWLLCIDSMRKLWV